MPVPVFAPSRASERDPSKRRDAHPSPIRLNAAALRALCITALILTPMAVVHAAAPTTHQTPAFHLPAGPLAPALRGLASSANVLLAFSAAQVQDKYTDGVSGAYTVPEALAQLLRGTGLQASSLDGGGYVIRPVSAGEEYSTTTLPTVNVIGTGENQSPNGPGVGVVATHSTVGTKTDTAIVDTPQSISVITSRQMQNQGVQTVNDALAYSASVQTSPYGYDARYDQFMIRGFTANQYGNYLDGMRQGTGSFAYYRNDPYDFERIEILRGPTSTLYGANEAGGLINMVSKLPTEEPLHEMGVDIGSDDHYQTHFDFSGPVDDNDALLYRLTGVVQKSGTQVPMTWNNRVDVSPSFTAKLSARTTLTVLFNYARNKNSMWPYYLKIPGVGLTHIRLGDPEFDTLKQNQWSAGYMLEHRFDNGLTYRQKLRVGQVNFKGGFVDENDLESDGVTLDRYSGQWAEHMSTVNMDNQLEWKANTGPVQHTVLVGADYFRESLYSQLKEGTAPSLDIDDTHYGDGPVDLLGAVYQEHTLLNQFGLYAQDQMVMGGWHFTMGARQDFTNETSLDQLDDTTSKQNPHHATWRTGLLYHFDNGIAPYLTYATSFLPTTGTSSPARGSTPFRPTTGQLYEGGVKYQPPGTNALLTASVYQITKNNVTTTDPDNTLYSVQTGQERSRGIELEGKISSRTGWSGGVAYDYSHMRVTKSNSDTEGMVPAGTPSQQASAFVDYTFHQGMLNGFGAGAGVRYIGTTWQDDENTEKNPSLTAFDLDMHYQWHNVLLTLSARNLFDRQAAICNDGNCTWSEGRVVLASLSTRW